MILAINTIKKKGGFMIILFIAAAIIGLLIGLTVNLKNTF